MTKNKFPDLNNHLFAQLERLSDEDLTPAQIATEAMRTEAIVGVSEQILRQAALQVQAAKIVSDHGMDPRQYLPKLDRNPLEHGNLMVISGKSQ